MEFSCAERKNQEINCYLFYYLLFYFRQTEMPIYSDPQEGSVVQCLDMSAHEVKADDESDVTGCPSGATV